MADDEQDLKIPAERAHTATLVEDMSVPGITVTAPAVSAPAEADEETPAHDEGPQFEARPLSAAWLQGEQDHADYAAREMSLIGSVSGFEFNRKMHPHLEWGPLPQPPSTAEQAKEFVATGGATRAEGSAWNTVAKGLGTLYPGLQWGMQKAPQEVPAALSAATGSAIAESGSVIGGAGQFLSNWQPSIPGNERSEQAAAQIRAIGRWLYGDVGKPVQEYAATFAADPEMADTFLVRTASMAGGATPYLLTAALGTAALGPYGGITFASAAAGASAYGRTYEEALAKGADHATAADAAGVSALTTAGLMALPVGGWVMRQSPLLREGFVRASAELAIHGMVFTTTAEAQKFADNLIARSFYDPERRLGQGVGKDIAEEYLVGMFLPGIHRALVKALPGSVPRELALVQPVEEKPTGAEISADRALATVEQKKGALLPPQLHRMAHELAGLDSASADQVLDTMRREGAADAAEVARVEALRRAAAPQEMAAFKERQEATSASLDEVIAQVGDRLGLLTPGTEEPVTTVRRAKAVNSEQQQRNRILAIASEGGRGLLAEPAMGADITDLAERHTGELAKYAFPGSGDPVASGFAAWFRDYVARPEDAQAMAPRFTQAFADLIDRHDPQLLASLEWLQQASLARRDARAAALTGGGGGGLVPPGGGLPPIPPPRGGGGAAGGLPQPPVPPAPKLPLPKAVRAAVDGYVRTFQPELFSDAALRADPLFARYKSASAHEKDVIVHQAEEQWQKWNKVEPAEQLEYMRRVELGWQQPTPELRDDAFRHRRMLDEAFKEEATYGSQAQYLEEYFPHLWKDPAKVREFFKTQSTVLGPRWFQKARSFDLIDQGIAAGFELKSTNPEELVTLRLMAGVDMRQRVELLQELEQMGMARRTQPADIDAERTGLGANGGPPLTDLEAAQLPNAGWRSITAPNGEKWLIAPDVQPLWQNAVEAKGLWANESGLGSTFRAWMAIKNVWVPLKLAISGFHVLHVAHIQMADGLARGWTEVARGGSLISALKSAAGGWSPIGGAVGGAIGSLAGPPGVAVGAYAGGLIGASLYKRAGHEARAAWLKPAAERSTYENEIVNRMQEGGFVPQLSEQLKINAGRALQEALAKGEWVKVLPLGLRRGIEKLQAPLFEKWIPHLKAAAYLNETAALLRRRPDLLDNEEQRRVAFRAIAKSVDNRFGEMFYGNLFWNRAVKDAGIASFLSLGWNLGFAREFGGGAMETATRRLYRGSESRQTIRDATNKGAFALIYGATAAMGLGMMSWLMTGEQPEGYDFIFPRIGGRNPDGSPRRITNMTYLREIPMYTKHAEDADSYVGGAVEMLWNKMMLEPFIELARNRDYYGYEIWSEDAPLYKKAYQFMKHVGSDQLNPITVSGARRAAELSGKPFTLGPDAQWYDPTTYDYKGLAESAASKGVGLSMLGFGPAPSYVERKPWENLVNHYFKRYVEPLAKPEERREMDAMKRFVRNQVALANQRGDAEAAAAARRQGAAAGLKGRDMRLFYTPYSLYQFSKLPVNAQARVLEAIPHDTADEQGVYSMYRRKAKPGALVHQ